MVYTLQCLQRHKWSNASNVITFEIYRINDSALEVFVSSYMLLAGSLPVLHTLSISHNRLQSADDIRELSNCHSLAVVDLSYNQLGDPEIIQVNGLYKVL
jgi:Leucine-rich repeat (LRR) protein